MDKLEKLMYAFQYAGSICGACIMNFMVIFNILRYIAENGRAAGWMSIMILLIPISGVLVCNARKEYKQQFTNN